MVTGRPLYRYIAEKYKLVELNANTLPTPIYNLINGGKHGAGNNLDFQEFHVIPSSRQNLSQALKTGDEIYQILKASLTKRGVVYAVGDEGGFAPNLYANADALQLLLEAITNSNYDLGKDVYLGLDVAATNMMQDGKYVIKDYSQPMDADALIEFYKKLHKEYRLFSIEDGLAEDDWAGWQKLNIQLGHDTMLIGDDLIVTNFKRLQKAIDTSSCNAVLIKPNQIGTISEAVESIQIAKRNSLNVVVSHRSGETNDDFIADFAVGVGANYTKFGAPARGERIAKYNRLLAIEADLKPTS
jgi:enolase